MLHTRLAAIAAPFAALAAIAGGIFYHAAQSHHVALAVNIFYHAAQSHHVALAANISHHAVLYHT